jgi:very-short-patch-repair endonuclease
MIDKTIKHNPRLTPYAQELRRNMTKEEQTLWYEYLHIYPYRFRRQVTIGTYILDFYCAKAKLAIELDGSQHFTTEGKRHDAIRTEYLEEFGIKVLRYSNWDITSRFNVVCTDIDRTVQRRINELEKKNNPPS